MFEIEYKGANCIVITTKKAKLFFDPKLSLAGLKDLNTKDAIEIVTEERFSTNNSDVNLLIDGPGEYGVAGFHISGIPARRHIDTENEGLNSTIYRIETCDLRIGVIGNIYDKLSDKQLEELGLIDILIIPVGGSGYTLDATGAAGLVRAIDPKIVVPVHYADNALKYEVSQSDLSLFVSEMGVPVETVDKYKLKQLPITQPTLSIVEIKRS